MVWVRMQILGVRQIFLSVSKGDWGVKKVVDLGALAKPLTLISY